MSDGEAPVEVGDHVRVCHKKLRVQRVYANSVTLRGELAGIHGQEIETTHEWAREHCVQEADR